MTSYTGAQQRFEHELRRALNIDEDTEPQCVRHELEAFRSAMVALRVAMKSLELRQERIDLTRESAKDNFIRLRTTSHDWEDVARWCALQGEEPTLDRREMLHSLFNHIRMGFSERDMKEEDRETMHAAFASRFAGAELSE